jgi:hypothetical protein
MPSTTCTRVRHPGMNPVLSHKGRPKAKVNYSGTSSCVAKTPRTEQCSRLTHAPSTGSSHQPLHDRAKVGVRSWMDSSSPNAAWDLTLLEQQPRMTMAKFAPPSHPVQCSAWVPSRLGVDALGIAQPTILLPL